MSGQGKRGGGGGGGRRGGKGRGRSGQRPGQRPAQAPGPRPGPRPLPVAGGKAPDQDDASPREEAEDLIDAAFETDDQVEQLALARKALERWPDAVDARLLLAAHAEDAGEAMAHRRAAVESAERLLAANAAASKTDPGAPLADGPNARAWVRARTELAEALLAEGGAAALSEARGHLEAVLRRAPPEAIVPDADGGQRPLLAACLLLMGDDAACQALVDAAGATGGAWAVWTATLLAFRRHGEAPDTRTLAQEALEKNPHVRTFLLGRRRLPRDLAGRVVPGEALEAALHVLAQGAAWRATAGALAWLEAQAPAPEPAPTLPPKLCDRVRELPQDPAEVWQAGWRRLPRWVEHEGARTRPWLALAVAAGGPGPAIVAAQMTLEAPTHAELLDALVTGMRKPREGAPRRPARVEVREPGELAALADVLGSLGVECARADALAAFDEVVELKAQRMVAESKEATGALAALAPARLATLTRAAADLYRAAPWDTLGDDVTVRIESGAGSGHAVVLGAAGLTFGLLLARDLASLESLRVEVEGAAPPDAPGGAVALLFEEPSRLPLADLEALEAHGASAAEDAAPLLLGLDLARRPRPLSPDEVDLLEALLRALPALLPPAPAAADVVVPVDGRPTPVHLSLTPPPGAIG